MDVWGYISNFSKKKKGGVGARHEGECDIYSAMGKTFEISQEYLYI